MGAIASPLVGPSGQGLNILQIEGPGTMVTGMGKLPAAVPAASEATSGPGPAGSVEAPSTRMAMSSSSSMSLRISSPLALRG